MEEKGVSLGAGYVSTAYQKCEYEGQKYYFHNGHWLNSAFVRVSRDEEDKLNLHFNKAKKAVAKVDIKAITQQQVQPAKKKRNKDKKKNKKKKVYKIDYDDRNFNDAMEHRVPGDMFRG